MMTGFLEGLQRQLFHNNKFQWDRAGAQFFGPVFHLQPFTVQQSVSLLTARLPEFVVRHFGKPIAMAMDLEKKQQKHHAFQ